MIVFKGDAKFWFGIYGKRSCLRAKGRSSRLIGQVIVFCVKVANGVRKRFSTLGISYTTNVSYNVPLVVRKLFCFCLRKTKPKRLDKEPMQGMDKE